MSKLRLVRTGAAEEAWRTMLRLMFEGEGYGRLPDACRTMGVSPSLAKAMFYLSQEEAHPMRDLAEHWGCDASYVTSLVDGLEERGFAERRPHATDRRIKTVVLTAEGAQTKAAVLARLWEPPSSFSALSEDEREQLCKLLRKLADADTTIASGRLTIA